MEYYVDVPEIGEVRIVQDYRIKRMSIKISASKGLWVNLPVANIDTDAVAFIKSNKEWILKYLPKANEKEVKNYHIGDEIKTRLHIIKIVKSDNGISHCRQDGNIIYLSIVPNLSQERINTVSKEFITKVLHTECYKIIYPRVIELAQKHNFHIRKIGFRNNTTNWGSCSSYNNISLNIKLIQMPDDVIDYVILHELCHTIVKNHSDEFWTLLCKICPDCFELRNKLKTTPITINI